MRSTSITSSLGNSVTSSEVSTLLRDNSVMQSNDLVSSSSIYSTPSNIAFSATSITTNLESSMSRNDVTSYLPVDNVIPSNE